MNKDNIYDTAKLQKELGVKNPMAMPKLLKIVVSLGVKDALSDKKNIERMMPVLASVAGQKPKVTRAKKSIAGFKLREGDPIGLMLTLRGKRMYDFFNKLTKIVLPRLRDFHGVSRKSFDGHGNYSLGFSEYTVFPEIDPGKVEKVQGIEVTIATSAKNDKEGFSLLRIMGMPFEKEQQKISA
ncbi:50S ribosomal protein L5 [Patescibacteria group bacterium]|nr:50S ribosomal protein L5 [Patescibacteria group bacterium]MCL5010559.1 50S ribosomal protein L5 [Patescibacteria group bacterium]